MAFFSSGSGWPAGGNGRPPEGGCDHCKRQTNSVHPDYQQQGLSGEILTELEKRAGRLATKIGGQHCERKHPSRENVSQSRFEPVEDKYSSPCSARFMKSLFSLEQVPVQQQHDSGNTIDAQWPASNSFLSARRSLAH